MRPAAPPVILSCGHVEIRPGRCATTDCRNYLDRAAMWSSMVAVVLLLGWVRLQTGRGAISIILDALPPLVGS